MEGTVMGAESFRRKGRGGGRGIHGGEGGDEVQASKNGEEASVFPGGGGGGSSSRLAKEHQALLLQRNIHSLDRKSVV